MRSHTILLALTSTLIAIGCGGVDDPFADQALTPQPDVVDTSTEPELTADRLGDTCEDATDCESAECVELFGDSVCISRCTEAADCVPGWDCTPYPEVNASICECAGGREQREVGNGMDDDCDGDVDEGSPRIAFWNVRDLSVASRDEVELSLIADVIEEYSLVALAEVSDDQVVGELEALLDQRGDAWTYELSSRIGDSGASAEHYAFIWREADFRLTESRELPEVLTENGDTFDREPFVGVFETVANGWEFALLNVHITWGDGSEYRVAEVRALAQYYGPLAEEFDDVILAGDLNLNSGDQDGIGWLTEQTGLSDITERSPATKVDSNNTYDHFLLDRDRTDEYTGAHGVDTFDEFLFPGDPRAASTAMSDHRPIWISVVAN